MREEDPRYAVGPLPESWDVTSDSIAARLAEIIAADELVLLKSAPAAPGLLHEIAAAGYVDNFFPQAAEGLMRVRFANLRGAFDDGHER